MGLLKDQIERMPGRTQTHAIPGLTRSTRRNCAALCAREERRVAEAVADAAVVFTAVGSENLACLTPALGAGLWRRSARPGAPPLNVIACENLPGAGAYLRHQVLSAVPPERTLTVDSIGGFSAGMTHRI